MNTRQRGTEWEQEARCYLESKGYFIIGMNFFCPFGEIDIIAAKDNDIVFIEVKYRKSAKYGYAVEAVTPMKQRKIRKTAMYYLAGHEKFAQAGCRFDVIAIDAGEITHFEDAF